MADGGDNEENKRLQRTDSSESDMIEYKCISDVTISKTTTTECTRTREFGFVRRPEKTSGGMERCSGTGPAILAVTGATIPKVTAAQEPTAPVEGKTEGSAKVSQRSTTSMPMSIGTSPEACAGAETERKWKRVYVDDDEGEQQTPKRMEIETCEQGTQTASAFQNNVRAEKVTFHQSNTTPADENECEDDDDDEPPTSPRPRRRRPQSRGKARPKRRRTRGKN